MAIKSEIIYHPAQFVSHCAKNDFKMILIQFSLRFVPETAKKL